jgi:hypothetical protein
VYSYAPVSFSAGFSVLRGTIPAQGVLPFPLDSPRWSDPREHNSGAQNGSP